MNLKSDVSGWNQALVRAAYKHIYHSDNRQTRFLIYAYVSLKCCQNLQIHQMHMERKDLAKFVDSFRPTVSSIQYPTDFIIFLDFSEDSAMSSAEKQALDEQFP